MRVWEKHTNLQEITFVSSVINHLKDTVIPQQYIAQEIADINQW